MLWNRITSLLTLLLCTQPAVSKVQKFEFTEDYLHQVLLNYQSLWNGNLSLANSTFAPAMTFQGDRFPNPTGMGSVQFSSLINSPATFSAFVQKTRSGFASYMISINRWAASGSSAVMRWTVDVVLGQNFTSLPT